MIKTKIMQKQKLKTTGTSDITSRYVMLRLRFSKYVIREFSSIQSTVGIKTVESCGKYRNFTKTRFSQFDTEQVRKLHRSAANKPRLTAGEDQTGAHTNRMCVSLCTLTPHTQKTHTKMKMFPSDQSSGSTLNP